MEKAMETVRRFTTDEQFRQFCLLVEELDLEVINN